MKKKSTKSALLMSFTSLLLCFAMLIGCTFAWFTDSVTSGVNTIVAGNLDIDVQYSRDGSAWADLQGSESLFGTDKWEPGHTEYVTLKIENKGTLALNYKMMVTPVTEKGGVNVSGQSFKLSDYLMFGTADATETSTYTRDTARAAVSATAKGLKQADLTKSGTMQKDAAAQYITLVVYMPTDVGNEANYKTGTAAPEIELGITVVATQLQSEADSFSSDYDVYAIGDDSTVAAASEYVAGPVYDYFPQVAASAPVVTGGNTVITAEGKLNQSDTDVTQLAKVTVPADALAEGVTEINVSVIPKDATNEQAKNTIQIEKTAGRETANFDIKVDGIKGDNNKKITVEVFVGKGLANVEIYHNGSKITGDDYVGYNATTGIVIFKTTSFSDYTVAYDAVCARIGEKTYGSLALAVAAASNGQTVTLLKSVEGGGVMLKDTAAKNITIDLDGKTYTFADPAVGSTGTETQGFHFERGNTVTVKNGTLNAKAGNTSFKMLIQNYCTLTLDNMTLDGTGLVAAKPVLSNNCGTVNIIGNTSITAKAEGIAFDAYSWPTGGYPEGVTVNVNTTGTITGNIELAGDSGEAKNTVNITNGNFVGSFTVTKGNLSITGGTFSSDPSAYVTTMGLCAHKNGDVWTVEACTEHTPGDYTVTETGHKYTCTACRTPVEEAHTLVGGVCVCGYESDEALLVGGKTCRIVGGAGYNTLQAAVNAATEGQTVKLLEDYDAGSSYLTITKGITLDFDTYKVTGSRSSFPVVCLQINAPDKTVTFKGTTGGIQPNEGTGGVCVKNGNLVIESGEYVTTNASIATDDYGSKTLTINGGKLTANRSTGYGRLIADFAGDVTINGGELLFKNTDKANYMYMIEMDEDSYTCTINGGTITADGGNAYTYVVCANSGDEINVNVNGGKVINANANGSYVRLVNASDATVVIKDINYKSVATAYSAIASVKQLTIQGGNFELSPIQLGYGYVVTGSADKIPSISGGTFNFHPGAFYRGSKFEKNDSSVFAEGYTATQSDGVWTVAPAAN